MANKSVKLIDSLHVEVMHFIDAIEHILEDHDIVDEDIVYVRTYFLIMPHQDLMNHVVDKILPWAKQIEKRNVGFFYDNKEIFGELPKDKVDFFSNLWKSGVLTKEDQKEIWDFFDSFVAHAESFKKLL